MNGLSATYLPSSAYNLKNCQNESLLYPVKILSRSKKSVSSIKSLFCDCWADLTGFAKIC